MWDLEDLLSKLNPMAEEFVPPSLAAAPAPGPAYGYYPTNGGGFTPVASPTGHNGVVGLPCRRWPRRTRQGKDHTGFV
ncbi:hypothetical protein ABZP36_008862 [Zizania latifolia]